MEPIVAVVALLQTLVTVGAFVLFGKQAAAERRLLVNAALSRTPAEFAFRQKASDPSPAPDEDPVPEQFPDGI